MKSFVKLTVENFDKMLKFYGREAHGQLRFLWFVFFLLNLTNFQCCKNLKYKF